MGNSRITISSPLLRLWQSSFSYSRSPSRTKAGMRRINPLRVFTRSFDRYKSSTTSAFSSVSSKCGDDISPSSNPLSTRLQQIYDLVPPNGITADIGADHGYLSIALRDKCPLVYSIERSQHAVLNAYSNVKRAKADKNVIVIFGDGLDPLIKRNRQCDTLVLAGMGGKAIFEILLSPLILGSMNVKNNKFLKEALLLVNQFNYHKYDLSYLQKKLGVTNMVLSPWPSYALINHNLHKALISCGWKYTGQFCTQTPYRSHHITSSFSYEGDEEEDTDRQFSLFRNGPFVNDETASIKGSNDTEIDRNTLDDVSIIKSSPLYKRYLPCSDQSNDPKYCEDEKASWISYLEMQVLSLTKRIDGLEKRKTNRDIEYSIASTLLSEYTSYLQKINS